MLREENKVGPIFILGAPRSGTTIVSYAVKKATGYSGHGEGHLWPLIKQQKLLAARYRLGLIENGADVDTTLSRTSAETLDTYIEAMVAEIYHEYFGGPFWVDKTPGADMVEMVETIQRIYPSSVFIFLKRHPIDCMMSQIRKFPHLHFDYICREWRRCNEAWIAIRDTLTAQAIEVEYFDLFHRTGDVSRRVKKLLRLDTTAQKIFDSTIKSEKVEQTALHRRRVVPALVDTEWAPLDQATFLDNCLDVSAVLGYDIRDSTVVYSDRITLFLPPGDGNKDCTVLNRNEFCCSTPGGISLVPNNGPDPNLSVIYRGVDLSKFSRFEFVGRSEFFNCPEVSVRITFSKPGDTSIRLAKDFLVVKTTPSSYSVIWNRGDLLICDISLSIRLADATSQNHYSTIILEGLQIR